MRIAFTSLVGLLLPVVARWLAGRSAPGKYRNRPGAIAPVRHLTTADGLSGNTVRCIAQDEQGFLRLGAQDGLSRYDGSSICPFRANARRVGSLPG